MINPKKNQLEIENSVTRIRKNVEHLTELVDEVLDIAKIEAGKLEVERVKFSLLHELAEAFASLQNRAEGKSVVLSIAFAGEIPESITSCPKRLRQIIINIVGNALKFTENGSVSIAVKMATSEPPKLCIMVKDTGCGLTREQQQRLFQPFTQADSSVTRKFGGTGLGLTLARRLAHALGGDVELIESRLNKGSTFSISIETGSLNGVRMLKDLTQADLEQSKEVASDWFKGNQRLSGMKILLVEDGTDNQALMTYFLTASGASVADAANGVEAIKKAEAGNYDLVLMDIQMPILDGYEATKRLRANGYKEPIVALTAHAMQGERERCLSVGCVDYISKPVKPSTLIGVVEKFVKKKVLDTIRSPEKSELADDDVVGPLINTFLENLPKHVAALQNAQQQGNYKAIEREAHLMAGTAGGYGFPKMSKLAANIEAQAKGHENFNILAESIESFKALCHSTVRESSTLH